ncbi:MAG: hypothetical protein Q7R56_02770 [Nanoarchaeota archaeon]|nr:hypothetical protein [Nanoarchaeota archaeon]
MTNPQREFVFNGEVIGQERIYDYLHTNLFSLRLSVPEDISTWLTGEEAFERSRLEGRKIKGIPANFAVYRLEIG